MIEFVEPSGFQHRDNPTLITASELANRFCNRYISNDPSKGKWRVLGGPVGCGKTMLARVVYRVSVAGATCNQIKVSRNILHSPETSYLKWIQWGSDEVDERDFNEFVRNSVANASLVIIDDIGAEQDRYKSGVGRTRLMRILEQSEKKWLFATTNLRPDEYDARYDERVGSRLRGAVSVWIDAPDYRQTKKETIA